MRKGCFVFPVIILMFLSSCDLFLGLPRLRENPDDDQAQVSSLSIGVRSPDTAEIFFVWKEQSRWEDRETEIDEIILVWSDKSLPTGRDANFLNGYSSETYKNPSFYSKIITGLSSGSRLYAALHAHSDTGWHAPLYAVAVLPDTSPVFVSSGNLAPVTTWEIYADGFTYGEADPPGSIYLDSNTGRLYRFDFSPPEGALISQATVEIFFDASDTLEPGDVIRIAPVVRDWYESAEHLYMNNGLLWSSAVDASSTTPVTNWPGDITEVVRAAWASGRKEIVLDMQTGTVGINSINLIIDYLD
jgi:hypothetical protein